MARVISPGDVITLYDVLTTPPKIKWFCCVCIAKNWFLRINTDPRFHGFNLLISRDDNPFLDHDSYLDFRGVIFKDSHIIQKALENPINHKGHLSEATLLQLMEFLKVVPTIPFIQKEIILGEMERIVEKFDIDSID